MKFVKLWDLLRYSERTTSKTPTRRKVGVLDVVLSEYVNKSHNFTNFIFMTSSLRNSIPSAFAKIGTWNGLFAIKRKTVFLPWSTPVWWDSWISFLTLMFSYYFSLQIGWVNFSVKIQYRWLFLKLSIFSLLAPSLFVKEARRARYVIEFAIA